MVAAAATGAKPSGDAAAAAAAASKQPASALNQPEVTPENARAFLKDFVIDPANLESLEDAKVLELHGAYSKKYSTPSQFPENWREQLAGEDDKVVKRLSRYASPRDVANALLSMQTRMSNGELRSVLKPNASAEELAAWRQENGIPDKPEGYDLKMPEGIVFGEADKPIIESFTKAAHAANFAPAQVKAALAWYHADREQQMADMAKRDEDLARQTNDALHVKWGNEYRRNVNLIEAMLNEAPKGVKEALMSARDSSDQPIFSNLGVIEWLDGLRRIHNPTATLVGAGTGDMGATIDTEIQNLEKMMKDKSSEYWKGPKAEANQARYRELIDARETLKARSKK